MQGVEYRPFILEQIFNFNFTGAPKNILDGKVEVVVEGERENTEYFVMVRWMCNTTTNLKTR